MNTKQLLSIFFFSRIVFILFAWVAVFSIPLRNGYLGSQFDSSVPNLVSVWANFDGKHFLSIATTGYHNTNFAYFPLYPALISILGYVLPVPHTYLGIILSSIAFIIGLYFLVKIVKLDYSDKIAKATVVLCCFFPLSFFYHSVYSDSLFFLLSILTFYFARKNCWVLSGIFCFLTLITRLSGIALLPALLVEWYLQNYRSLKPLKEIVFSFFRSKALIGLVIGALGIFLYMLYLQLFFGDFFLFQKSFSAWGQSGVVFPPQVVFRYLKIFLSVNPKELVYWIAVLEFICLFAYLSLSYYVAKKVRLSYGIFMFVLLLLVPFTGTFAGTPRYILHLFPGFLGLTILVQGKYKIATMVSFIILGLLLTALFTRGYFVA